MPRQPVEIVRDIYERWGEGDFDTAEVFDRLVVFVVGPEFPDAGTYLGPQSVAGYMRGFLEPWDCITIAAEELIEAGDTVVVAVRQEGVGSGSGAPGELSYFHAWTFRGEKAIRWENFRQRAEALAAAGLS